ncbi:hypothetical protein WJX72_008281 [[Myrmecia] bisecta]|uniref:PDZ domain-containing protein n=1 Tax=[Myrmecia] bisecta TaxID=41462 RepID=A0AAW1R8A1_9CHLO
MGRASVQKPPLGAKAAQPPAEAEEPEALPAESNSPTHRQPGDDLGLEAFAPRRINTRRRGPDSVPPENEPNRKRRNIRGGDNGTTSAAGNANVEVEATPTSPMRAHQRDLVDVVERRARDVEKLMESVVKVFCVHSEPNFSLPWQRKRQYSSTSSGFIISGRRILTNAHSVDHHTQVKVRRRGSDTKFVASVLAVGTECDIAMLTVEDESFWQGLEPVKFGQLPRLQESVTVIGYPIGGDTMSVTSGVVSRIEVTSYVHGAAELLGIQIDAAINSGNSGGPAFNNRGECVGIAFQSLKHEDAENIGYVIPPPVIEHFIHDYERNGHYTAFPMLGIEWQKMESPFMRKALGMKPGQKGVLVRRVEPTSPASKILKKGDILLSFDGVDISNDGTVPFRSGERISFSYLVSQKYTHEEAQLRLLQNGKVVSVTVNLAVPVRLIPVHIKGRPPSYFIIAGMVFTVVTVPYMRSEYGKEYDFDAPVKLLDKMMHAMTQQPDQQIVVLSQVLASDAVVGYEDLVNTQVLSVNDTPVNNLRDLVQAVDTCKDKFLRFELEYNQMVVLETQVARDATADILLTHCIPSDRSANLRPEGHATTAVGATQAEVAEMDTDEIAT